MLIIGIWVVFYWCVFLRFEIVAGTNPTSISSVLGMATIMTALAFLFLMTLAHHINYLEMVRARKVSVFRVCIAGLLAVAPPTIYEILSVIMQDMLLASLLLFLAIFLLVAGKALLIALIELLPDLQILSQPPRNRLDILPLDAMLIFMFAMPLLAKIFH